MVLHRDCKVMKIVLLEQACLINRGFCQSLRGGFPVARHYSRIEGTGVYPNPQGSAVFTSAFGDFFYLVIEFADISRINPYPSAPALNRGEHIFGLEMNIGDYWNRRFLGDYRQSFCIIGAGAGYPHNIAPGCG